MRNTTHNLRESAPASSVLARSQDAELVALGVGQYLPGDVRVAPLSDLDVGSAERQGALDLRSLIVGVQVEMHPVLARLDVGGLAEQHGDAALVGFLDRDLIVGVVNDLVTEHLA